MAYVCVTKVFEVLPGLRMSHQVVVRLAEAGFCLVDAMWHNWQPLVFGGLWPHLRSHPRLTHSVTRPFSIRPM